MNKFTTTKQTVSIVMVKPNAWNPNKQDDFIFQKEVESIKRYGFLAATLVRELPDGDYEIIDGEHRWKACKHLGYTEIAIESVGKMKDEEAKTLTLLLNNIKGTDDPIKRGLIFNDLKSNHPDLLKLMPFEEQTILNEIELVNFKMDYPDGRPKDLDLVTFKFVVDKEDAKRVVDVLERYDKDYDTAFLQLIHSVVHNVGKEIKHKPVQEG